MPKVGDRVTIHTQQSDVFAVLKIRKRNRTADLILLPSREFVEEEVPWRSLIYMDERM